MNARSSACRRWGTPLMVLLLAGVHVAAAETAVVVFSERFTDATAAQRRWTLADAWRLDDGPDGQQSLRIDRETPGRTVASVALPVDQVAGRTVRWAVTITADQVSPPPNAWNGVKAMLVITSADGSKKHPQATTEAGTWDWRRVTATAPVPGDAVAVELVLGLEEVTGSASFANITVSTVPLASPLPLPPLRRNLLDNPGFDIGASGWFLEGWEKPLEPSNDRAQVIRDRPHSGDAALRMPAGSSSLLSGLVTITPGSTYTASVFLRSRSPKRDGVAARFFMITPDWQMDTRDIPATDLGPQWRRFTVRVTPVDRGSAYLNALYLRLDAHQEVEVDSLQLELGPAETAYEPGLQIGLVPPSTNGIISPGGGSLQALVDVPADDTRALVLTVTGVALDGTPIYALNQPVPAGAGRHVVRVPAVHDREGVVDCRLTIAAAAAPDRPLVTSVARYAVFADDPAPNPLLGSDCHPLVVADALVEASERIAGHLGLGLRRTALHLDIGPLAKVAIDDERLLELARRSLRLQRPLARRSILAVDPAADSWLSLKRMQASGTVPDDAAFTEALAVYADGVAAIAMALDGLIDDIEVLNEPNLWLVDGNPAMPAQRYAQVLAAVRAACAAAGSSVRLAANVNGVDLAYLNVLGDAGGLAHAHVVTIHPYRNRPETPPLVEDLPVLRALLDRHAPAIPVVNSEQYYGTRFSLHMHEHERGYFGDDEADVAGRTLQTALHGFTAGLPFCLLRNDFTAWVHTPFSQPWWYRGAGGLRALARLTHGVTGGTDVRAHEAVRVLLFTRADGTLLASVNAREPGVSGTLALTATAEAFDVDGNPMSGGEIPIGYLPIYLRFPAGTTVPDATAQLIEGAWRGFGFPVHLTATRASDGAVVVRARNAAAAPVRQTLLWTALPAGVTAAAPAWPLDLGPGATATFRLQVDHLSWQDDPVIGWESTGETPEVGVIAIPTLAIPRLAGGSSPATWLPATWLSADDAPVRFALAWNEDGLHVVVQASAVDAVQLAVHPTMGSRSSEGDAARWLLRRQGAWLAQAPSGRFVGAHNASQGADPLVSLGWTRVDHRDECRITLPPDALPAWRGHEGGVLGISLTLGEGAAAVPLLPRLPDRTPWKACAFAGASR